MVHPFDILCIKEFPIVDLENVSVPIQNTGRRTLLNYLLMIS